MIDRNARLLGVLKVGHETSMRGEGISLRDALIRCDYNDLRPGFGPQDLVPLILERPALAEEWLAYSEDKRTSGGWYLMGNGQIGRVGDSEPSRRFNSLAEAVADYVVRELDFWAALGDAV